jgi:transaldolase (EC 2.2.1.2)
MDALRHYRDNTPTGADDNKGLSMDFFADTAVIDDIRELHGYGLLDGVTTNPSLIAKSGGDFLETVREIAHIVPGPISAEVAATDHAGMMAEAQVLSAIAENVVIKVPLTLDGLKACRELRAAGTAVNVTLCFSANQALLAAKAGATYVSPFIGRLDDINLDGMELIHSIRALYDTQGFDTQILAASIRNPNHVSDAALAGADVATMPPEVIRALVKHPLTDKGLEAFIADWKKPDSASSRPCRATRHNPLRRPLSTSTRALSNIIGNSDGSPTVRGGVLSNATGRAKWPISRRESSSTSTGLDAPLRP